MKVEVDVIVAERTIRDGVFDIVSESVGTLTHRVYISH